MTKITPEKNNYHAATFILSAAKLENLPSDDGYEVAFIGRSNAGKSSAINKLTEQRNLARVSKTPGRTQLINLFKLSDNKRLVDLPGYGYAKVPEQVKKDWGKFIDDYLCTRKCLRGLVLLVDIRHLLKLFDLQILTWASQANLPIHILLTKADKLKYGARKTALQKITAEIKKLPGEISTQIFSATENIGHAELKEKLNQWFNELA